MSFYALGTHPNLAAPAVVTNGCQLGSLKRRTEAMTRERMVDVAYGRKTSVFIEFCCDENIKYAENPR